MTKRISIVFSGLLIAGVCGWVAPVTSAQGSELLNFKAQPPSNDKPEFVWTNNGTSGQLSAGSGSTSNGDGTLAPSSQTAPGLQFSTPLTVSGVSTTSQTYYGGQVGTDGSTTFYDASLVLGGLVNSGSAVNGGFLTQQGLGGGTFEIDATSDTSASGPGAVLLKGTIDNAVIAGMPGSNSGGTFSATVTYKSGLIYDAMLKAGYATSGSFSWSVLDISPVIAIDSGDNLLRSFSANGTGQFNVASVPEPASGSAALVLLGLLVLIIRRGSRRSGFAI